MSSDGSGSQSTLSKIRQFGLYRTVDARTEEFLRLSRKRQLKQGCACAAISTAVTVTVVVIVLLIYEYITATYSKLDPRLNGKEYWQTLVNRTHKNQHTDEKNNLDKYGLDQKTLNILPIILKALKHNKYLDSIAKDSYRHPDNVDNDMGYITEESINYPLQKTTLLSFEYNAMPIVLWRKFKTTNVRNLAYSSRRRKIKDERRHLDYFYKMIKGRLHHFKTKESDITAFSFDQSDPSDKDSFKPMKKYENPATVSSLIKRLKIPSHNCKCSKKSEKHLSYKEYIDKEIRELPHTNSVHMKQNLNSFTTEPTSKLITVAIEPPKHRPLPVYFDNYDDAIVTEYMFPSHDTQNADINQSSSPIAITARSITELSKISPLPTSRPIKVRSTTARSTKAGSTIAESILGRILINRPTTRQSIRVRLTTKRTKTDQPTADRVSTPLIKSPIKTVIKNQNVTGESDSQYFIKNITSKLIDLNDADAYRDDVNDTKLFQYDFFNTVKTNTKHQYLFENTTPLITHFPKEFKSTERIVLITQRPDKQAQNTIINPYKESSIDNSQLNHKVTTKPITIIKKKAIRKYGITENLPREEVNKLINSIKPYRHHSLTHITANQSVDASYESPTELLIRKKTKPFVVIDSEYDFTDEHSNITFDSDLGTKKGTKEGKMYPKMKDSVLSNIVEVYHTISDKKNYNDSITEDYLDDKSSKTGSDEDLFEELTRKISDKTQAKSKHMEKTFLRAEDLVLNNNYDKAGHISATEGTEPYKISNDDYLYEEARASYLSTSNGKFLPNENDDFFIDEVTPQKLIDSLNNERIVTTMNSILIDPYVTNSDIKFHLDSEQKKEVPKDLAESPKPSTIDTILVNSFREVSDKNIQNELTTSATIVTPDVQKYTNYELRELNDMSHSEPTSLTVDSMIEGTTKSLSDVLDKKQSYLNIQRSEWWQDDQPSETEDENYEHS